MRRALLLGSSVALLASSGCSSLLGLDDFTEGAEDPATSSSGAGVTSSSSDAAASSGTTSTSQASSASTSASTGEGGGGAGPGPGSGGGGSGAGEQGGGGEGGRGEPCDDEGAAEDCYDGDPEDVGIGLCVAGSRRCSGGFWSACDGDVLSAVEDLGTWADESCETDSAEVRAFVRYDGDNDDYTVGMGIGTAGDGPTVAVGLYGALTIGGQTYSTDIDAGTVFVKHALDGSVVTTGFLPAFGGSFWPGNGYNVFAGYMEPQTINGVDFASSFVALLDTDFAPLAALDLECGLVRAQHGLCGPSYHQLTRFQINVNNGTISANPVFDFGTVASVNSITRTSGAGTPYLIAVGGLNGTVGPAGCSVTGTSDPLIATFSPSNGSCVSMSVLESNGSAGLRAVEALGNTVFVSGSFSGSIRDENGQSLVSEGTGGAFVARMALTNGIPTLIWLRAFGGSGATYGGALAPDDAGGTGWLVEVQDSADFGDTTLDAGRGFVSLDSQGNVRYARAVGPGVSPTIERLGDAVVFFGYISDVGVPFGLGSVPPAGSSEDAFLSIHALP